MLPTIGVVVLVVLFLTAALRILNEYERGVIFRLGRVIQAKGPGLIILIPIVDKMVKVSMRLVADQVRGLPVERALQVLTFSNKKAAEMVRKVLESAIANAEHNEGADVDELKVKTVCVDEGPTMKRIRARAKGRAARILKRTSHITVIVADD